MSRLGGKSRVRASFWVRLPARMEGLKCLDDLNDQYMGYDS